MNKFILVIILFTFFNLGCLTVENKEQSNVNAPTPSKNQEPSVESVRKTQIAPSADTLSAALTLLRKGKESTVEAARVFMRDDGIKLNINTVEKGYLIVIYKGSDGDSQVIFPNKDYFNGKNEIDPNKNIAVPGKGWFFLDEKKGTETIFVVYSKHQILSEFTVNPKQTVESFEKLRSEKNNAEAFTTESGSLVRVIEIKHN